MTNETIQEFINALNGGSRHFVLTQIGSNVWWGNSWYDHPPNIFDSTVEPEKMFFIKEGGGRFAAGVFWHDKDEMHWYVDPKFRGKGLLVQPLKEVVLPFLFKKFDLTVQRGSVDKRQPDATASTKLAKKLGFESEDDYNFIQCRLSKSAVAEFRPFQTEKPTKADAERRSSNRFSVN